MVKVYCAKCGRFSWDVDMVRGKQVVTCPQCHRKTTIIIYSEYNNLKVKTK